MIAFKEKLPPQITESEEREIISHWNDTNKNRLIEGNMRLALFIAKRFAGKMDDEELVCISMVGLVKAANAFNPDKGVKFNTFASHVIQNAILYALRKQKKTYQDVSMQTPVTIKEDQECELEDVISDEKAERNLELVENLCFVESELKHLSNRERRIIISWMNGATQRHIASEFGTTQSNVSRILMRAFKKMKERIELNGNQKRTNDSGICHPQVVRR